MRTRRGPEPAPPAVRLAATKCGHAVLADAAIASRALPTSTCAASGSTARLRLALAAATPRHLTAHPDPVTMRALSLLLLTSTVVATVAAQSNTIPGTDGRLTDNSGPSYFGRRGPANPNGEIGISYSYTMCNAGTVDIPWTAPMNPSHPMFAFMVVRESNGRMEQITNSAQTYVKHAFGAANGSSTCGPCQSGAVGLHVGCSDTYGA